MHQFIKILTSLFLLVLLISHGVIQFGMFEYFRADFRTEAAKIIGAGIDKPEQAVFCFDKSALNNPASKIEWKKHNEFRFEGKLYDIIRKEIKGDSVFFYCFYDEKETILYCALEGMIEEEEDSQQKNEGFGNYLNQYYFCGGFDYDLDSPRSGQNIYLISVSNPLEGKHIVNTPPPRSTV